MADEGRIIRAACLAEIKGVSHGFFTRQGGVSSGLYSSLNCGLGSKDEPGSVRENRDRVARSLGAASGQVVTLYQVHSAIAVIADKPLSRGAIPKADALVTRTPGLVVGALAADCSPVLLADAQAKVVAAVHAGWRGALRGVIDATIAAMERVGAARRRIRAAIGPCINQAAYEVGPEFEAEFLRQDKQNGRFFSRADPGARPRFDLPRYVEQRLASAGLDIIERHCLCTWENESLFFSYRRATHRKESDYGRQISAIVVT
ncbi:MAG TPA: peptidoglycan editing factor PgeF [Hyphomicrobiaceae bacterium]|nr:peptidoglycan editing factor PgeF [Hyphomicrobiaceae bacterium]